MGRIERARRGAEARSLQFDEDALTGAVVGGGDRGIVMAVGDPYQRPRPPGVVARHSLGAHVGDPVFQLHENVRAMVEAEPVSGTEVLVDPNAHWREANEPVKPKCY